MATYHFHIIAENNDGFGVPSDVAGATADTPGVVTELRAMASMKQFCTQHRKCYPSRSPHSHRTDCKTIPPYLGETPKRQSHNSSITSD